MSNYIKTINFEYGDTHFLKTLNVEINDEGDLYFYLEYNKATFNSSLNGQTLFDFESYRIIEVNERGIEVPNSGIEYESKMIDVHEGEIHNSDNSYSETYSWFIPNESFATTLPTDTYYDVVFESVDFIYFHLNDNGDLIESTIAPMLDTDITLSLLFNKTPDEATIMTNSGELVWTKDESSIWLEINHNESKSANTTIQINGTYTLIPNDSIAAGIAVGIIGAILIIAGIVGFLLFRKKNKNKPNKPDNNIQEPEIKPETSIVKVIQEETEVKLIE